MDYDKLLADIYQHLAADNVEQTVMGCVRLARSTKDYINLAIFLRELFRTADEFTRAIYNDMSGLKSDAQKLLCETAQKRWLELHTLEFSPLTEMPDHNVLPVPAGQVDAEIDRLRSLIADLVVPPNMDPFDIASFTDSYNSKKATYRLALKGFQTVKARLKARCQNYASQMEQQLELQRKNQGFLDQVQNDVNNFFKARSDSVFAKLQKAAELAIQPDLEDAALLLTEVRRALKAAADFFYPPVTTKVIGAEGKELDLGEEKYLNRLREFLARRLTNSTSKELLKAELEAFGKFLDRLNNLASKGVHASVALAEARQGLVSLYFFLFNLSQNLSKATESE